MFIKRCMKSPCKKSDVSKRWSGACSGTKPKRCESHSPAFTRAASDSRYALRHVRHAAELFGRTSPLASRSSKPSRVS